MATNGILNKVKRLNIILYTQCRPHGHNYSTNKSWLWDVTEFMDYQKEQTKYGVIILNRPISQNMHFIKNFWNNATLKITVDGGTSRWDSYIKNFPQEDQKNMQMPDLVTGDFDSITEEVLQKYKMKGCKVIHTPDQNYTDFTKSLIELSRNCEQQNIEIKHVIAIAQASGRIDHTLGNIQTLFLARQKQFMDSDTGLYLLSDDALSWLLFPGDHVILIPDKTREYKRSWCSLVPVGEKCESVSTRGLKWNLDNAPLQFGELVSTSNAFDGSEKVIVSCSNPLLWSMKIPKVC